jgi:UDP-N-acetyl-2-amino-2-deoxyglucuronate dehydrogenase
VSQLRVGVIGYGYTGKIHAQALLLEPGARLTAVADSQSDRLRDLPPGVRGYTGYHDLLKSEVDAVSICLPTYLHCEVALNALASGKHVLVEKPIAVNLEEAERMLQAAKAVGRVLYVGMTHRFYPELQEAKKLIDDGAIGEIVACTDCALEHLGFLDLPPWYLQKQFAGGGAALTSGIHLVDRLRWFTGDEVKAVAGSAANPYFGSGVEDAAQMFLRFERGVSAEITLAFMREPHPLVCDLRIIGTRGSVVVHTWSGYELWNASGHRNKNIYTDEPHVTKVQIGIAGEIAEFCSSIAAARPPWPSAEESTRSLAVVTAFYKAAKNGDMIGLGGLNAV